MPGRNTIDLAFVLGTAVIYNAYDNDTPDSAKYNPLWYQWKRERRYTKGVRNNITTAIQVNVILRWL